MRNFGHEDIGKAWLSRSRHPDPHVPKRVTLGFSKPDAWDAHGGVDRRPRPALGPDRHRLHRCSAARQVRGLRGMGWSDFTSASIILRAPRQSLTDVLQSPIEGVDRCDH